MTGWNAWMLRMTKMPKIDRLRIPGVKAYVSKDRLYAYHRKTGHRFKATYGSAAFWQELHEVEARAKTQPACEIGRAHV